MTRATRPARTGTARPSARKARGRPLSYMSQRYASARPVAGKKPCLNPGWMFAMELTPDLGAARGRANGRRYHRAGQHRLPTASTDAFWAKYGLAPVRIPNDWTEATLPVIGDDDRRRPGPSLPSKRKLTDVRSRSASRCRSLSICDQATSCKLSFLPTASAAFASVASST